MSRSGQTRLASTKTIPHPSAYILAMRGEYQEWVRDEESAPLHRGRWRELFGEANSSRPLDLEIGTGNGTHFAHHAQTHPERLLLGMELKYKPLIQSIRRARRLGAVNARVIRHNAALLPELFADGELNDVFIFFPDPWEKLRQHKHRLIQDEFLQRLHRCQRPGSKLVFKTDSLDYFRWAVERFKRSPYQVDWLTEDLHGSGAWQGFRTQFEQLFIRQGLKINLASLSRLD
jgi:tRNA (guanine-N7-)-methyltransferase